MTDTTVPSCRFHKSR